MGIDNLIGKPAADIPIEIARLNPAIKTMIFNRYSPRERDELDMFWHFSRDRVLEETEIRRLTSSLFVYGRTLIGFTSLVEMLAPEKSSEHTWAEIPMLFFTGKSTDPKAEPQHIIDLLKTNLGLRDGWIISAPFLGREGYYYCGADPLSKDEWRRYLISIKGLKDDRISVSNRYIDLALLPKIAQQSPLVISALGLSGPYTTLRISTNDLIDQPPIVVSNL